MVLAPVTRVAGQAALPGVQVIRLPELDSVAPLDAAERLAGWPGLVLLESARPGRRSRWTFLSSDPIAVISRPSPGRDPFVEARRLVARLDSSRSSQPDDPPFLGGLAGFLGYDLGLALEPRAELVPNDQELPLLRLALHDWVVAWDRRTGQAFLGGRAVDGDRERLAQRLVDVRARITGAQPAEP